MIKNCVATLLLWCSSSVLFGQQILTFEEVIERGLENNYGVKIAVNEVELAENNIKIGRSAVLPTLNATYGRSSSVEDVEQKFVDDATPRVIDGAQSSNKNFNLVAIYGLRADAVVALKRLGKLAEISDLEAKIVIENTVAAISSAYYRFVLELQRNNLLEETLELSKRRLDIAQAQYELGQQSKSAYLAAQVDYNADLSLLISQSQVIESARISLNELLAMDPSEDYIVNDTIQIQESISLDNLLDNAIHHNKLLLVTQREENVAFLQLQELRAQRLPTLTFNGNYVQTINNSDAGFIVQNRRDGYNFGATIGLNLFSGFSLNRRIQNARIQQVNQRYALEQYEVQLNSDIYRVYNIYENSKRRLDIEKNNFEVVAENTEIAFERFKMGLTSFLEFRDAQVNRLAAEIRLIESVFSIKEAEIELMRLSGQIFYQDNGDPLL